MPKLIPYPIVKMQQNPVDRIKLDNGLFLEFFDRSRPLAGDRWLVSLEARIEIPIDKKYLSRVKNRDNIMSVLKEQYGEKVEYSYVQEKHFVDEKEKDKIFGQFLKNIKENLIYYLSHPEFATKTLLAKYRDLKRKAPWLFQ